MGLIQQAEKRWPSDGESRIPRLADRELESFTMGQSGNSSYKEIEAKIGLGMQEKGSTLGLVTSLTIGDMKKSF
jgi:hypothetical protein